MKLLLIDDDRDQRRILSMLVRKIGLNVTALNQFDAQAEDWSKYGLVIVDAMMPIVSGPQLVQEQAARLRPCQESHTHLRSIAWL